MAIIGNAVVDMEEERLNKMTAGAFEIALPILQVKFESPFTLLSQLYSNYTPFTQGNVEILGGLSARPCTTSDQRSAIRKSLKTFYGY